MSKDKPNKIKFFKIPAIGTECPKCKSKSLTRGKTKDFKCMACRTEFNQEEADGWKK